MRKNIKNEETIANSIAEVKLFYDTDRTVSRNPDLSKIEGTCDSKSDSGCASLKTINNPGKAS